MAESKIRYGVVRRADTYDDQKPPAAIESAEALALTQEEYQEYILSQIKRIIFGSNTGQWKEDFEAAGIMGLGELTTAVQAGGHLLLDFTFADVGTTPIGLVPAGGIVETVALLLGSPFDQPVLLEVGTAALPAQLMLGVDNNPQIAEVYQVDPDLRYTPATTVTLTMISLGLPPTTGSGRVIVYLG